MKNNFKIIQLFFKLYNKSYAKQSLVYNMDCVAIEETLLLIEIVKFVKVAQLVLML